MTRLPFPDSALDDRMGVTGTPGSGKTYCSGVLVERILERNGRVVIPDALGVWYGLRLMPDGKRASHYNVVIFGGPHGDLPINEHAGALVGETVAGMAESAIIDLSEFGTKAAERRFMLAFLTALYRKASGEPVHLVFDEADLWAPQRVLEKEGEATKLLGIMETIVRRGRIKGFIPWLITQRPAVLSKNVLAMVDGLIAFKTTSSQDRKALWDWIEGQADVEQGKQILASLPALERGQGVVWVPGRGILETVKFPKKRTYDSSRTPKRGETVQQAELKPLNIEALRERMASVEAETKANDPRELRRRIAELEREAKAKPSADHADMDRAHELGKLQGHAEGYKEGIGCAATEARLAIQEIENHVGLLEGSIAKLICGIKDSITDGLHKLSLPMATTGPKPRPRGSQELAPVLTPENTKLIPSRRLTPPPPIVLEGEASVRPATRKILDTIHAAHPLRLTFAAAAARAGISRRSSQYRKYRQEVRASGEVTEEGDYFRSNKPMQLPAARTDQKPVDTWAARLPPSYGAMLRVIAESSLPLTREEVAERAGVSPKSSGLTAGLRELMSLALIQQNSENRTYELAEALR